MRLKAVEIATHPRERINLGALRAAFGSHDIMACILIPTFQNPLGNCMPDENKRELADLLVYWPRIEHHENGLKCGVQMSVQGRIRTSDGYH